MPVVVRVVTHARPGHLVDQRRAPRRPDAWMLAVGALLRAHRGVLGGSVQRSIDEVAEVEVIRLARDAGRILVELRQQLRSALDPEYRDALWAQAKARLPRERNVAHGILDYVSNALRGSLPPRAAAAR